MNTATFLSHPDRRIWKIIFLIAGLYTTLGVLPGILNPKQGVFDFTGQAISDVHTVFLFRSLWIVICLFGIGYLMVARRPSSNSNLVILGLLGKLIFAVNVILQFQAGQLSSFALTAAVADFVFVGLFGVFLWVYYINKNKMVGNLKTLES